jgi:hypothetical protein
MWTRRTSAIIALVAGPVIGAAYPFLQLAYDCQAPVSEACVWGKALLAVSVVISIVFIGSFAAAGIFAVLEWRRRARQGE